MMTREQVRQRIQEGGIVPVLRASRRELAAVAAGALIEGGIFVIEVTTASPCVLEVIEDLRRERGDVVAGGGNVLDVKEARACLDAGAQFLTTPCFVPGIIEIAREADTLIIVGALTPTEVLHAWNAGADFVNVFPCGRVGGPDYIKSLKGAMPDIPMMPTGGVTLSTAAAFLDAGASALGVGAELVLPIAVERNNPIPIVQAAKQFAAVVRQRRGR